MKGKTQSGRSVLYHKIGVQIFNPVECSGRGLSCNATLDECLYAPGCPVWQRSYHGLVR
jgi:hypothetical protein